MRQIYYRKDLNRPALFKELEFACNTLYCFQDIDGNDSQQVLGTSTNVRLADTYFTIFSRHQVRNAKIERTDLKNICIQVESEKDTYLHGMWFRCPVEDLDKPFMNSDGDSLDFATIIHDSDFIESDAALQATFFNLNPQIDLKRQKPQLMVATGFPTSYSRYEIVPNDDNPFASSYRTWQRNFKVVGPCVSREPYTREVTIPGGLPFNPDGISGGAVFGFLDHPFGYRSILLGMIIRGGRNSLRYLEIDTIITHLNNVMPN